MRVQAIAVVAAGLVLFGVAGCASSSQTGSGSAGGGNGSGSAGAPTSGGTTTGPGIGGTASSPVPTPALAAAAAAGCPNTQVAPQSNPKAQPVPADIQVAFVLRCRIVPGNPTSTVVAERSTSDPAKLVRALRTPSAQRQKVVCPMFAVYLPYFALVEPNGTLLAPKLPLNNCGMVQSEVVSALETMQFTQISSRPVR